MMGLGQTEFHDRLREAQGLRVFIGNSKRKCDSNPPFPFLSLFLEIFSAAKTISPKSESMAFAGSLFRVFWFLQFFYKRALGRNDHKASNRFIFLCCFVRFVYFVQKSDDAKSISTFYRIIYSISLTF